MSVGLYIHPTSLFPDMFVYSNLCPIASDFSNSVRYDTSFSNEFLGQVFAACNAYVSVLQEVTAELPLAGQTQVWQNQTQA